MIITLGGHIGAGKSTLGRRLSESFGFPQYSTGGYLRNMAKERGITLAEINQEAEHDGGVIDTILDDWQKELGEKEDNFIIDGHIAFHFIPHAVKIFLSVDAHEAARRIYSDATRKGMEIHEDIAETVRNIEARRNNHNERYGKYYGVSVYDVKHYDLVVDTTHKSPDEVYVEVMKYLEIKDAALQPKANSGE